MDEGGIRAVGEGGCSVWTDTSALRAPPRPAERDKFVNEGEFGERATLCPNLHRYLCTTLEFVDLGP